MRAIIYTRVSTDEQAQKGYSLDAQAEACRARAISLGASEILLFSDEGVSGSLLHRPGLDAALDAVRRNDTSVFICTEPDRLSRKLSHQLLLTDEIERSGSTIEFVTFNWDSGPEGRLFYAIKGALAEYERHKILERTRAGKVQKALRGELTHSPNTFGYVFDSVSDRLAPSAADAPVVRYAFDLVAWSGEGPAQVASRLNSLGIPSPRGRLWSRTTVGRMLRNSTYTGTMYLRRFDTEGKGQNKYRQSKDRVRVRQRPPDQWIPVKVPALVDEATWSKAQASLEAARRRRPNLARRQYLLRGLVRCGRCGQTMHGSTVTTRGVKRPYYVCTAKSPGLQGRAPCPQPYFPAVLLEDAVWEAVASLLARTAPREELRAGAGMAEPGGLEAQDSPGEADLTGRERVMAREALARAMNERDRLIDMCQRGIIDTDTMDTRMKAVRERLSHAQEALECRADAGAPALPGALPPLEPGAVLDLFNHATEFRRERLIRAVVHRVTVEHHGAVTVECYIPGLPIE